MIVSGDVAIQPIMHFPAVSSLEFLWPMTAAVQRTAATISFITVPPEGPRPTDLTQMNAGLRPDYRCADTTNATPNPPAPLDERPHRAAHLRSAARHCHPPITRPSFMSRLERIRTIPVVHGGNRADLFAVLALVGAPFPRWSEG